ncbi:saccharopine dehydrogenase [Auricularia subglabra TFB-10046 SS5]|nr:saccharopine dehydrogenase [Auricularia subglabra TFB-10046 SS5]
MSSFDVLVLGATGYTGKLVTRYLASHPERGRFSWGIGARSRARAEALLSSLSISKDDVTLVELDVTNEAQVNEAIARTKVVINTAGPFYRLGTPVIKACARQGKHYVDLTGETYWIMSILGEIDSLANRTGAIIIPSCGLDSLPSDLMAFLSVRALQQHCESRRVAWPGASSSSTGFDILLSPSGGTLETMRVAFSEVPKDILLASNASYSLSPVKGKDLKFIPLPVRRVEHMPQRWGGFFIMASTNRAIIQRSWGLFELQHSGLFPSKGFQRYGADFKYDEFLTFSNPITAFLRSVAIMTFSVLLAVLPPVRWLVSKMTPPGSGPSESALNAGYINATNVTHLASEEATFARTTLRAKGDPGYLLTSVMIAESALALLFSAPEDRGPLDTRGGLLTPATALGDVLPDRLRHTGLFEITSEIVRDEDRKTR